MIEVWKITKAVDINVVPRQPGSGAFLPYKVEIKDKHVLSEDEEKTKEYDKLAYKVLLLSFSLSLSRTWRLFWRELNESHRRNGLTVC